MTNATTTTISERVWNASQSWYYELTLRADDDKNRIHTLRVSIRRNAYDDQSFAHVEKWNSTNWAEVVRWPIQFCECKRVSYVDTNVSAKAFAKDATKLLDEALAVLS